MSNNQLPALHCTLTDMELAAKAETIIDELIKTGGKSFRMQVPARPNADTDLIFSELNNRFKKFVNTPQPNAVWVKASERLPEKCGKENTVIVKGMWGGKWPFVAFGFRNFSEDDPRMYYEVGSKSDCNNEVEWLDESPAELPGKLTQERADFIREVNGRDLNGATEAVIADLKAKGDKMALELRRLARSVSVHPDYGKGQPNEFFDLVDGAHQALAEWSGEKEVIPETDAVMIEFCYRYPDGKIGIRYRRLEGTADCKAMIKETEYLIEKAKPAVSPYFYRKEGEKEVNP